jgi:glycosyltransferase involved in cell wall biosynthesis
VAATARRTVHAVLHGRKPAPGPRFADLRDALRTESRLPLTAHLVFWLGTLLGLLMIPLIPLLVPLAVLVVLVKFLIAGVRPIVRFITRRLGTLAGGGWRAVWGKARPLFQPIVRLTRQPVLRFARGLDLIDAAYRLDANVYQANDYDTLLATWITARLRGVPFVYDIHELYDESFPTRKPFRTRYMIRLIEGRLIRRAIRTITVGDEIARVMHERYGVARPAVIRNAQPYDGEPTPVPLLRETIGDGDREPRRRLFVYAGRVALGRGLPECVLAMTRIDPEQAALVILGDGDPARLRELRALVAEHDLGDRVHLVPAIPSGDLPGVLADADVGLMLTQPACLSYYYGLGNKLFHYVNAGIPVLVPKQPEKQKFVEAHGVGHCCDDLTPEAIAAAMQRMIDSPEWLETLKSRCREVAPTVSWQREATTYRSIYEGVYERILFADDPQAGWFRPWRRTWSPA